MYELYSCNIAYRQKCLAFSVWSLNVAFVIGQACFISPSHIVRIMSTDQHWWIAYGNTYGYTRITYAYNRLVTHGI